MFDVTIITDGSCIPQDERKPGGWAALLDCNGHCKTLQGGQLHTTSQRMEVIAVIEAVKALKAPCSVKLRTDSQYVIGVATGAFSPKANSDLWDELHYVLTSGNHHITFEKVAAHTGDPTNELCDDLAKSALYDNLVANL